MIKLWRDTYSRHANINGLIICTKGVVLGSHLISGATGGLLFGYDIGECWTGGWLHYATRHSLRPQTTLMAIT